MKQELLSGYNVSDFLFYNAIPKTGSQSMEAIFSKLAKRNHFMFKKSFEWENRTFSLKKQVGQCLERGKENV